MITVKYNSVTVATIDSRKVKLLSSTAKFRSIWNTFVRDGVRMLGPSMKTTNKVLADSVQQSHHLGAFLHKLEEVGYSVTR